jgi:hypothetical protein
MPCFLSNFLVSADGVGLQSHTGSHIEAGKVALGAVFAKAAKTGGSAVASGTRAVDNALICVLFAPATSAVSLGSGPGRFARFRRFEPSLSH